MGRPVKDPAYITEKQARVLLFIEEWAGERGFDVRDLPPDYIVATEVSRAFGFCYESAKQFLTQLRAAGCFGNPTDIRLGRVNDLRREVLKDCYQYLSAKVSLHEKDEFEVAELRRKILGVL